MVDRLLTCAGAKYKTKDLIMIGNIDGEDKAHVLYRLACVSTFIKWCVAALPISLVPKCCRMPPCIATPNIFHDTCLNINVLY